MLNIIQTQGLSILISILVLIFGVKYMNKTIAKSDKTLELLNKSVKDNSDTNVKILVILDKLSDKLVKEYADENSLRDFVIVKWLELSVKFRHTITMYLVKNNIKENIDTIKSELEDLVDDNSYSISNFFKNRANEYNRKQIQDLLESGFDEMNRTTFKVLDNIVKLDKCSNHLVRIRNLESALKKIENNILDKIDKLNF